ncbi:MAG: type III-B CRISPR module RAMP protein Cmr1 [Chloroflexota bacterium]|jgi:CRISPR-associated protein Cmr1
MSAPKEFRVTLETVTPLFLGGAEPRSDPPELRASAFRSAMRYWFRVTAGGVIGDHNLEGLHKLESALFGSQNAGSPIALQVSGNPSSSKHFILPHKQSGPRKAFDSEQEITLTIRARSGTSDLIFLNVCMALNLALLFGGVGLRSRRGFGSLRVAESSDAKIIPPTPMTLDNDKWKKRIEIITTSAITWATKLAESMNVPVTGLPNAPTNFPSAAKGGLIRLTKIEDDDSEEILKTLIGSMPQVNYLGGIFPHQNPSRQSSPLWARVFWADDGYHLLMCFLPSKLAKNAHNDYAKIKPFLDSKFPGIDLTIPGWNA